MALSPALLERIEKLRAEKLVEQAAEGSSNHGTQESSSAGTSSSVVGSEPGKIAVSEAVEREAQTQQGTEQPQQQLPSGVQAQTSNAARPAQGAGTEAGVSLSSSELILSRIEELKESLQRSVPGYEGLLKQIHMQLAQDEELTHILSEEQIGVICAGLAKRKNVVLVAAKAGSGRESKRLSTISVDEI